MSNPQEFLLARLGIRALYIITVLMLLANSIHAQNVGIGTITPVAKLDVIGTLKVTDGTQHPDF